MLTTNYKDIKCPHCGKSHFSVFHSSVELIPSVFTIHPDPIYKDGVLQNPEIYDPKPEHELCTCQECGKKFWLNTRYECGQVIQSVETEEERKTRLDNEWNNLFNKNKEEQEIQEEVEKVAEILGAKLPENDDTKIEDISGITNLEADQGILTYRSDEPTMSYALDDKTSFEEIKSKVDDMWIRLEKIEGVLNDR